MESCVPRGKITWVVWSYYEITEKRYLLHGLMKISPLGRIQCPERFESAPKSKCFLNQSEVLWLEYSDTEKQNGASKETVFQQLEDSGLVRSVKGWVAKGMLCLAERCWPRWSLLGLSCLFSVTGLCKSHRAVPLPSGCPLMLQLLV